jgi:putative ABC transport system ATP-binding protein
MIELREVSKTVMSGTEPLTILHPLSLQIPRGQFVAVVGPSGSGKSTLLGLIAGLDAPSSGSVLIDTVDITRLDEDSLARLRGEKVGFVFQFFHLIPSLTAYENVAVPMEIAGLDDARPRAEQLLEEVGLTGRAHHYPSQLSGGEQQRVALARALANDPPIVLADEPTGNLDSANGRHIMELLRKIHNGRGTTIVLVTHDAELAAIADARLIMRDGRVVENTLTLRPLDRLGVAPGAAERRRAQSERPGDPLVLSSSSLDYGRDDPDYFEGSKHEPKP